MFESLKDAKKSIKGREFRRLHGEMMEAVSDLKKQEARVIRKLQEIDQHMVYRYIGYNSLFRYAVNALQLTEAQAFAFITVARKSLELPALQQAIDSGELTVSKAVRVTSVIDEKNQREWVDLAVRATKREVEKLVAEANPRAANPEKARFVNSHTVELQVPLSEDVYKLLERARELVSQSTSSHASLEVTLETVLKFYLDRKDPLRKAILKKGTQNKKLNQSKESTQYPMFGRQGAVTLPGQCTKPVNYSLDQQATGLIMDKPQGVESTMTQTACLKRDSLSQTTMSAGVEPHSQSGSQPQSPVPNRKSKQNRISAKLRRQVYQRDQMSCVAQTPNGTSCGERRWIDIHHLIPRSAGGIDSLENLVTLCRGHHQLLHAH